jgi:hypothetical protein
MSCPPDSSVSVIKGMAEFQILLSQAIFHSHERGRFVLSAERDENDSDKRGLDQASSDHGTQVRVCGLETTKVRMIEMSVSAGAAMEFNQ